MGINKHLVTELMTSNESTRIEPKCSREMCKSDRKTVIAFANEPRLGGGHLLRWCGLGGRCQGRHPAYGKLPLEGGNPAAEGGKQASKGGKRSLPPLPPGLTAKLPALGQRMGETALRQLIRDLCGWQALRGEELATLLGKDLKYLRNKHLSAMVQAGELVFQFPESPNHKLQAYKRPNNQ